MMELSGLLTSDGSRCPRPLLPHLHPHLLENPRVRQGTTPFTHQNGPLQQHHLRLLHVLMAIVEQSTLLRMARLALTVTMIWAAIVFVVLVRVPTHTPLIPLLQARPLRRLVFQILSMLKHRPGATKHLARLSTHPGPLLRRVQGVAREKVHNIARERARARGVLAREQPFGFLP